MSDFGNLLSVTTRKDHRCEWCGEKIIKGSKCVNYRGMFQDEWQNWYMHPECENACAGDEFSPYENDRPTLVSTPPGSLRTARIQRESD